MHESWNDPISYRSKFRTDTAHHGTCSQIVLFSSHFYLIYFLVWEPPKVLIHLEITNILHNFNYFEDLKFIWKVKFSTLWCNNYYILFFLLLPTTYEFQISNCNLHVSRIVSHKMRLKEYICPFLLVSSWSVDLISVDAICW